VVIFSSKNEMILKLAHWCSNELETSAMRFELFRRSLSRSMRVLLSMVQALIGSDKTSGQSATDKLLCGVPFSRSVSRSEDNNQDGDCWSP
jgi:hypothetical protein